MGSVDPLLYVWLGCTSLIHTSAQEFKAACLFGLALAQYAADPLCYYPAYIYTYLHVKYSGKLKLSLP